MKRQSIFSKIFLVLSLISTLAIQTTAFADGPLTGTASISGSAVYGEILTASFTGDYTGELSYKWMRTIGEDTEVIADEITNQYTLVQADIGATITVEISSGGETGSVTSDPTDTVVKAQSDPPTGVPPVVSTKTDVSITMTEVTGYEYVITENDVAINDDDWQDSNVFTGLSPITEYDAYQRVKETDTHFASETSAKLDVTTLKSTSVPPKGIAPVLESSTSTSLTVVQVTGYEYIIALSGIAIDDADWQTSNEFTGLEIHTDYDIYQRIKETDTVFASEISDKITETTDYAGLTGTATISGTPKYGETLSASLDSGNNSGDLNYQWMRGDIDIEEATLATYVLTQDDIDNTIKVKITSTHEAGTVTSDPTAVVEKADSVPPVGVTPVLESKTATSITVTSVSGYEYVVTAAGIALSEDDWQDSNELSGLSSNTSYDIYQRVKATDTTNASAVSGKITVKTEIGNLLGTAEISGTLKFGETISAALTDGNNTGSLSYQWVRGSSDIASATNSTYTLMIDDIGHKISVKITSSVETGTVTSEQTAEIDKADSIVPVGQTPQLDSKTSSTVTLKYFFEYEYKIVPDGVSVDNGNWQSSNVFTGLSVNTEYDFYQRVTGTLTQNPSAPSEKLDVKTGDSVLTGTVNIVGVAKYGMTFTASLVSSNNTGTIYYQWVRDTTDIPSATSATYTVTSADIGHLIKVKVTSSSQPGVLTSTATSSAQKADSTVSKGATPKLYSKSRTTVTLTAVSGYEYTVVGNGAHYSTGKWQASNVFTGLSSNTSYDFYQRVKETSTHKASVVSDKLDVKTNASSSYTTSTYTKTATPKPTSTLTSSPSYTATPTVTITPSPTPTVSPTSTPLPVKAVVTPANINEDKSSGMVTIELKTTDLPSGTQAFKTPDGKLVTVSNNETMLLSVNKYDIKPDGTVELVMLDDEGVALGYVNVDASQLSENSSGGKSPIFWVIIGLAALLVFLAIIYIIGRVRSRKY